MGIIDRVWAGAMRDKEVVFREANLVKDITTAQATGEIRRINDVAKNVLRRK